MRSLYRLAGAIDRLNDGVGKGVSWLTLALVLLVCFDVVVRYLFSSTQAWIMELEWHFFAMIFLLGAGFALRHDRHVRVDLFYSRFSARDQALVNLVGGLLFLLPWCLVIMYAAFHYALGSWKIGESSPDPGGLPMRYVIKFTIVLGLGLLFLQGVANLIHALRQYLEGGVGAVEREGEDQRN